MKQNHTNFAKLWTPRIILLVLLFFTGPTFSQEDLSVDVTYTIDGVEEYQNVNLASVISTLNINGSLIVHGNLEMSGNQSQFNMGPGSYVIIYGDFISSNLVDINISDSSYLFIYGDFIKQGSENQGNLNVENGNIYIFGDVDNWGDQFTTCNSYDGNTNDINKEECDYGGLNDFENNHENFPDDLVDVINCYDLSDIRDEEVCQNGDVNFSVASITGVDYRWQEKDVATGIWSDLPDTDEILNLTNVPFSQSGNQYRVIVTPVDPDAQCTISISRDVTLTVTRENVWTGSQDTNWNNASNWKCHSLPDLTSKIIIPGGLTNYPVLNGGDIGLSKNIEIETGASAQVLNNTLRVADTIFNKGTFDLLYGRLELVGTSIQVIPANTFKDDRIKHLFVNNPEGLVLRGNLEVTGIVRVESGNIYISSDSFLKLVSDSTQTALIDGSGKGEITGTVKMQRYLDNSFGYKYFSSPFTNSTVGDFSKFINLNADFPNFYRYKENRQDKNEKDATGWEVYTSPDSLLNVIEGYALNFGDSIRAQTVEISGRVNNGNYTRTLYNHNRTYTKGFNLVGNPYPSPIDWEARSGWTKNNIDNAIYFFTAGSTDRYRGTYTSYVNGVKSDDNRSSNIIPSMQGFFVHVSDADTYPVQATLGMTNEVRVNNFDQPFLKRPVKPTSELIRITAGFEGENINDPLVVYFNSNATLNFEKDLDAHKLLNTAVNVPNFYSITPENDKLAISAVPNVRYNDKQRIPLGIKAEKSGTMIIRLKDLENISSGSYIYLIDQEKKVSQDLNSNPVYRFQAQKGEDNSRFYLLFSETRITAPDVLYNEPFSVETENENVRVRMNLGSAEKGTLRVSTVAGQIISNREVANREVVEINEIGSAGLYIFNYLSGKEVFSKKVLIGK